MHCDPKLDQNTGRRYYHDSYQLNYGFHDTLIFSDDNKTQL